jgi:hypothetical protein
VRTVESPGRESEQRLSRRDLIKKAAVTGGIVWATPVIMTSPAFAAGTVGTPPVGHCTVFVCGEVPTRCSGTPLGPCARIGTVEGDCVCVAFGTGCSLPTCSSSTDCPPGSACVGPGCCGGPAFAHPSVAQEAEQRRFRRLQLRPSSAGRPPRLSAPELMLRANQTRADRSEPLDGSRVKCSSASVLPRSARRRVCRNGACRRRDGSAPR